MSDCEHDNFVAGVEVYRLSELEAGPVTRYMAEVRIRCRVCGAQFQFVGLPKGVSFEYPLVSGDGTELRAPIAPPSREQMLEVS